MIQDEVESQLSAMFDGELPATECELLSRRIDRDENLRARWSRYALIGAAMRSEPVATARSGFARRVSAALESLEKSAQPDLVHRLDETIADGLEHERMIWHLAFAAEIFWTRLRVRKHDGQRVGRAHLDEVRRHLLAVASAQHGQRARHVPACI